MVKMASNSLKCILNTPFETKKRVEIFTLFWKFLRIFGNFHAFLEIFTHFWKFSHFFGTFS